MSGLGEEAIQNIFLKTTESKNRDKSLDVTTGPDVMVACTGFNDVRNVARNRILLEQSRGQLSQLT